MIRVLYNALHLTGQFSGIQHTEEMLMNEALCNPDPEICFEVLYPKGYHPTVPVSAQHFTQTNINSSRRWQRIAYEHFVLNRYAKSKQTDILHCPAYILPWNRKGLNIATIHDTIALDFPEYCSTTNRAYFHFALPHSIRKADKIIAVSHTVKNDILRKFSINPDKIVVINHGLANIFWENLSVQKLSEVRQKYHLPERFILFVGNIEPKKNIPRLIDAYRNLHKHNDIPHVLVIAGQFAWKYQHVLQKTIKQTIGKILFLGYIHQSDLPAIYTLADLFVFPSLYEGFGLPPLEAMACGVPTMVSNVGALPEITNGNSLVVDPLSTDAIEIAMYKLIHDQTLREQLITKGRHHALKFKWNTAWNLTKDLYRSFM